MQEKFIRKTMKRIAAVGAGVAMVGATLTGAMAYDLADYPEPFVVGGVYDDTNVFVVGDTASADDTLGVADITAGLQYESKTAVTSESGTSVSVSGGKSEQIPLNLGLTNTSLFDTTLEDDDVSNLFDGEIVFQSSTYDTSEQLAMADTTDPSVESSLTSADDDYKSDVYLEVASRDKIKFAYKFDETINLSKATSSDPLSIEFLGDPLKITSVPIEGTKFTAYVGDENYLTVDESVTVEINGVTKTVTLRDVSSTSAVVDVDGTEKIISDGSTATVNGVEITVDDVFSRTERAESSANLVVGAQSTETYNDGDAYIDEDTDDPNWVWNLAGLQTAGTAQTFEIENDFVYNDVDSGALTVGECISLPNDYVQICYDSLSVASDNYATYTFEYDNGVGLDDVFPTNTSVGAIYIHTNVDEGLQLIAYTGSTGAEPNVTSNVKAKEVWLYTPAGINVGVNGSNATFTGLGLGNKPVGVFYKDTSTSKVRLFGEINLDLAGTEILRINYENTKDTNIVLRTGDVNTGATTFNLTLNFTGDTTSDLTTGYDDIRMQWGLNAANTTISKLGLTKDTEEAYELYWGNPVITIGSKDEDQRNAYGVIIKNPKSNGASDQVELSIPADQVKANVVIKGTSSTVTGGSTSYELVKITPVSKTVSEVGDETAYNLVLVGGPCANALVEDLFGLTCDGWSFEEGEAVVKLADNGDKVALLVAGTTAADTRRAAKAIANYDDYEFTGTEAIVSGTSDTDIDVAPATA